jgi:signal transduction histidine kinase/ActR/RegA family two-component response regulator
LPDRLDHRSRSAGEREAAARPAAAVPRAVRPPADRPPHRPARHLDVVASLGRQALLRGDLGELLHRGLEAVRDVLEVPHVALFEPVPGAELLVMRAGLGWREGAVGQLLLKTDPNAQVTVSFAREQAVITDDEGDPLGFDALPLFREHGIVSGVSAILLGPEGPTGVLGAYSTAARVFSRADLHFVQAIGSILAAAIERKGAEEGLIQSEIRLQSVQKMEAIGRLAGGIAHDFNNLVQAIGGYTEILLKRLPEGDALHRSAEEIKRAGDRAAALTRQLLAFSRQQVLQPKVLDLNTVVINIEQLLRRLIGEDVELETVLAGNLGPVRADAAQLEQVLMNLAVNSRDAMPDGGTLTIETRNVELTGADQREAFAIQTGGYVLLAVSDTGCGMSAETRARAFEPFFTTKPAGQGTGLGLSTVYGIVKQSGGYIWVDSEPGVGTRIRIYLPRVEGKVEAVAPKRIAAAHAPRGSETLLLVEDEEGVRDLLKEWMLEHGYAVLAASNGVEALALAESVPDRIDLLIADVVMPQMGGPALASRLLLRRPGVRVLYMSGYADEAIGDPDVLREGAAFLQKPFTLDSLVRKVREILDTAPATE